MPKLPSSRWEHLANALGVCVGGLLSIALVLALAFSLLPNEASAGQPVTASDGFLIELGDVFATPGQQQLLVEVLISNPQPLDRWEMGLEYDEWWLLISEVITDGTASQTLNADVTLTPPSGNDPARVVCEYVGEEFYLPPGTDQLVAYLVFAVNPDDQTSLPLGTTKLVDLVFAGEQAALFALLDGETLEPETVNGTATIYSGSLLVVGEAVGDNIGTMRVPVYLWNPDPVFNTFSMGLEYDEWWLSFDGLDLNGGVFENADATIVMSEEPDDMVTIEITFPAGFDLDAGYQQLLFHVLYSTTDDKPGTGSYPLTLVDSETQLDLVPVDHFISGNITVEPLFVRGDLNFDGVPDITDVVLMFDFLFFNAPLACAEAANANADSALDITDPIFLLGYLYLGGPTPPPPFPLPGETADPSFPCF